LRQSSESLAGRIERVLMGGLTVAEVGWSEQERLWVRGGLPRSFLASDDEASFLWRREFVQTFLERDVPQMGASLPALTLHRFWTMVAHYHGQIWNAAEPARSLGISEPTVRRYLDLLSDLFMVRQLPAWHANLKKRHVKAPKVYVRDVGLLHGLLDIRNEADLWGHPKCGASWEGRVIEEVLRAVEPEPAYFWTTHQGAEIDLVMPRQGRLYGVECKWVDAPTMTPSLRIALQDLGLERIAVVYPGKDRYPLHDRIEVVPLADVSRGIAGLFP
jgi:predicted AAA+ superfamily ATPase